MSKSKKDKPFIEGDNQIGRFVVRVHNCVFDETDFDDGEFFEVLVSERTERPAASYHVHLGRDERFKLLSHIGSFTVALTQADLVEHNAYINRRNQEMPTWKLSRRTLLDVIEICKRAKPMRFDQIGA